MIEVKRIEPPEWKLLSRDAHVSVFREDWDADKDRIDYALLTVDGKNELIQFATIRELDAESAYIQYGGSFPNYRGTATSHRSFQAILRWLDERYKNVSFLTENTNFAMLKFAIKERFVVIGVRNFKNHIMLEHFKTKEV